MSKDAGQKALQHFLNGLARVTARSRSMVARCISVLFSVTIISPRNRCLPPFGFLLCAALGDFAARLERAIERSGKVINGKAIEGSAPQLDHKPAPMVPDRCLRRGA